MKKNRKNRRNEENDDEDELGAQPVGDIKLLRSFVYYGRSGTGKTSLAATHKPPILFLDVNDKGTDSIADVEDVFVKSIKSTEEWEKVYWYLYKHPKEFKTVVIDTVSQLQQIVTQEVAEKNDRDLDKSFEKGGMTRRDFGKVSGYMKKWIENFRDLPMEVVFIAQDRVFNMDDEEERTGDALAPEVGPALSPSVVKTLNAAVMVIGNTYIRRKVTKKEVDGKKIKEEKFQYCLRIGPNSMFVTKIRKQRSIELPDFIVNPTYEKLLEVIKGEEVDG